MGGTHVSNEPVIYAIVIGTVFVLCAVIFLVYGCMVERRQRLVLNRAVQSTAVVWSLFPKNGRERLMEEHAQDEDNKKKDRKNAWNVKAADKSLQDFLEHSGELTVTNVVNPGKPIANHFDASTTMLRDLVGFTKWSSTRTPQDVFALLEQIFGAFDVFALLEQIFGAFDVLALRRKVFKVETIGDCYVAVTGVPEAQVDHAVIMVRFARECLSRLRMLTQDLKGTLGEDTADLNMRIPSGPISAGVLRGEEGRFQLFGDTINTASRMESNGRPGSIQVSDATAQLLKVGNKAHWFVQRDDKIVAKGKGEMKTYWVATGTPSNRLTSVPSVASEKLPPITTADGLDLSPSTSGLHSQLYLSDLRQAEL